MNNKVKDNSSRREIYVAFSGGGAKAFIHVGALSYLEERHRIVGVSGTSAGALVAVLKAAGFSAKDMFIPKDVGHGESALFDRIKKRDKNITELHHLLGGEGLSGLRDAHSSPLFYILKKTSFFQKFYLIATLFLLVFAIPAGLTHWIGYQPLHIQSFICIILSLFFLFTWLTLILKPTVFQISDFLFSNGIACTDKAIEEIEHQVAIKLGIKNRPVLMRDFKMSIRIIAANLDRQAPQIFSNNTTPLTPLRDALSASICIPLAFKPHLYEGSRYIDGGIVSNMPAFVFSEELSLHPSRRIVALRITHAPDKEISDNQKIKFRKKIIKRLFGIPYNAGLYSQLATQSVIQTLFTGAQDLAHSDMEVITPELPTNLHLLDFDINYEKMKRAYAQGQAFADKLVSQSFKVETIYNDNCALIAKKAKAEMDGIPFLTRRSGSFVRVAVSYCPFEGSNIMKIKHSYGFGNSSDQNVVLPLKSSVCGRAWEAKKVIFEHGNKKIVSELRNFSHISSRINSDIQWILAIPILDKETGKPRFVINIDSNTKIFDTINQTEIKHQQLEIANKINAMLRNLVEISTLIGEEMRETLDSANQEV
ncbi:patatin-like phospholipase family protein [Paracoccus marcusii]|uniref:patatin-like phospholipase family protein n=1 Tax=Paracoccus marcusii TaxID=59779 RepID=UPI0035A6874B